MEGKQSFGFPVIVHKRECRGDMVALCALIEELNDQDLNLTTVMALALLCPATDTVGGSKWYSDTSPAVPLEELRKSTVSPEILNKYSFTIYNAASVGHLPILRWYLSTSFQFDRVIQSAAEWGQVEALEVILNAMEEQKRTDPRVDEHFWVGIASTMPRSSSDLLYFIQKKQLVSPTGWVRHLTANNNELLAQAAQVNNIPFLKFASEQGVLVVTSQRYSTGLTPFDRVCITAAEHGRVAVLKWIKSVGYDGWNVQGNFLKLTPAMYAGQQGKLDAFKFFKDCGADIFKLKDKKNLNAADYLALTAAKQNRVAVFRYLQEECQYKDFKSSKGIYGNLEIIAEGANSELILEFLKELRE